MSWKMFTRCICVSSNLNEISTQHVIKRGIKRIVRPHSNISEVKKPINDYLPEKFRYKTRVFAWGQSLSGALGVKDLLEPEASSRHSIIQQTLVPNKIEKLSNYNNILDVAACHGFSIFVVRGKNHVLLGCGLNVFNQIGWQEYNQKRLAVLIELVPINLPISTKSPPIKVDGGRSHSLVLLEDGTVYGLGSNALGQLGLPIISNVDYNKLPSIEKVQLPEQVSQICCGLDHSIFLTKSGQVYSCGLGADGQTGLGHYKTVGVPELVKGDILGEKIVQIAGSADSVLALSENGEVFGWGNSEYMQFTTVCEEKQLCVPKYIPVSKVTGKVTCVAAGGTNCAVINDQNQVYTWGFGILGQGPKVEFNQKPTLIPSPVFGCDDFNPDCKVINIVAGLRHFAALTNDGDLYMWGSNRNGCLGMGGLRDDTSPDIYYPMKVKIPGKVIKVSLGTDHTVAIVRY